VLRIARKEQQDCSLFRSTSPAQEASVAQGKGAGAMDAEAVELTIKLYVSEVRSRLDKAAGIARAADACAGAGFCDKAVEITLDIEQPLYEATTLLNAASLISRLSKAG
jgi:hypothetical protein